MLPIELDKYLYIRKTPTWLVRTIYITGFITWFGVIYGYAQFYFLDKMFFFVILPFIAFLVIYHLLSYALTSFYKQLDLKKHLSFITNYNLTKLSSTPNTLPSIDIFLPICGENTEVLRQTFTAVSEINYPNITVYVLDDKGLPEHKDLAETHRFTYLSRENKGHMKKAGNLKHGYERSDGDYIIVFDADFAPHPDFVRELLPYMEDPAVGIIQSPQYFQTDREVHDRSDLEYGASYVQEDFYRFIQVARSRLGAPICCGSNAIYRRSALDKIGGTVQIEHSEDAYTGFALTNQGYRVKYLPIILAVGPCPSDLHSYFHQQHRWCSGSLSLMLNKQFWLSRLNIWQKLCFISGFMYYLSHPVTILMSFQVFFLLFFHHDYVNLTNAIPFYPCILFTFLIIPLFRITKNKTGSFLARNSYNLSYTHASITAFIKKSVGWQPTNTKRVTISRAFTEQFHGLAIYFFIYVGLIALSISLGTIQIFNLNSYSLLFWIFYNTIATSFILVRLYLVLDRAKQRDISDTTQIKRSWTMARWRLRTAGAYALILISTVGITEYSVDIYRNYKSLNVQNTNVPTIIPPASRTWPVELMD